MTLSHFNRIECPRIKAAFIALPAAIGLVAMLGLSTDAQILCSWAEGRVTTKISTAFGLLALSYLLLQKQTHDRSNEIHGAIFITLLMVLGFMGFHRETDEIQTVGTFVPSLGTAIAFGLFVATTIIDAKWLYRTARVVAAVALVGHAMGDPMLYYYIPPYSTGMAIPTALGLLIASFFRP